MVTNSYKLGETLYGYGISYTSTFNWNCTFNYSNKHETILQNHVTKWCTWLI